MSNGANSIHKKLRHDLEDYIKAQYFGKSPLLLSAVGQHLEMRAYYIKSHLLSRPRRTKALRMVSKRLKFRTG